MQKLPQILVVVSKFLRFSTNSLVKTKKKQKKDKEKVFVPKVLRKPVLVHKNYEKTFLLANSRAVNTNLGVLGLDLHSSSPKPINFFGAQSSLEGAQFSFGGHKQSFGGARPRNVLPWCRACGLYSRVSNLAAFS